jgi:hypothetical protein
MSQITVKLEEPIQFGSRTIDELTLRKPKAKDMRQFPLNPQMGDMLDLASRLAGEPTSIIDELSVQDMTRVVEVIGDFLGASQATGTPA